MNITAGSGVSGDGGVMRISGGVEQSNGEGGAADVEAGQGNGGGGRLHLNSGHGVGPSGEVSIGSLGAVGEARSGTISLESGMTAEGMSGSVNLHTGVSGWPGGAIVLAVGRSAQCWRTCF